VAGSCEYGDEPSGSGVTELVSYLSRGIERDFDLRKERQCKHAPRSGTGRLAITRRQCDCGVARSPLRTYVPVVSIVLQLGDSPH
jgi:hypothetical protein